MKTVLILFVLFFSQAFALEQVQYRCTCTDPKDQECRTALLEMVKTQVPSTCPKGAEQSDFAVYIQSETWTRVILETTGSVYVFARYEKDGSIIPPGLMQAPGPEWSTRPVGFNPQDYLASATYAPYEFSPVATIEDPLVQEIVGKILEQTREPKKAAALINDYFINNFTYGPPANFTEQDCRDSLPADANKRKDRRCISHGSSWRTLRSKSGDCLSAAYTTAALMRAAGIPTIIGFTRGKYYVENWTDQDGGYGIVSHYYNYIYLDGDWYFLEPQGRLTLGKYPPADNKYMNTEFQLEVAPQKTQKSKTEKRKWWQ